MVCSSWNTGITIAIPCSSSTMVNSTNKEIDGFSKNSSSSSKTSNRVILLGANGFLGRNLASELVSPPKELSNLLVYDRENEKLTGYRKNIKMKSVQFDEISSEPSSDIVVVNCMSARRPSHTIRIEEANYSRPVSIVEKIRNLGLQKVFWLQPESYWQYAVSESPDDDYVYWKQVFSKYLREQSQQDLLHVIPLVLCHLIGANDDANRFIPRLVRSLRTESEVEIINPNETLYLSDVDDVSYFLSTSIKENSLKQNKGTQIFPFQRVTIRKLIDLILEVVPERPKVRFIDHPKQLAPRISEHMYSLPVVDSNRITPLQLTLKKISDKLKP